MPILNVGGPFLFDLTTGSRTRLTQTTLEARLGLTEVIGLETRLRWKTADMQRNAVFPTGNVEPVGDLLNGALGPRARRLSHRDAAARAICHRRHAAGRHFIRLQFRDPAGRLIALGNGITVTVR